MGEVEREVRAEVRFEVVDGMLEGFFVGQVLTGLLLNQSRFSAQNVPVGEPVRRVVARDALILVNQHHGKCGQPPVFGLSQYAEIEAIWQILNPSFAGHFYGEAVKLNEGCPTDLGIRASAWPETHTASSAHACRTPRLLAPRQRRGWRR